MQSSSLDLSLSIRGTRRSPLPPKAPCPSRAEKSGQVAREGTAWPQRPLLSSPGTASPANNRWARSGESDQHRLPLTAGAGRHGELLPAASSGSASSTHNMGQRPPAGDGGQPPEPGLRHCPLLGLRCSAWDPCTRVPLRGPGSPEGAPQTRKALLLRPALRRRQGRACSRRHASGPASRGPPSLATLRREQDQISQKPTRRLHTSRLESPAGRTPPTAPASPHLSPAPLPSLPLRPPRRCPTKSQGKRSHVAASLHGSAPDVPPRATATQMELCRHVLWCPSAPVTPAHHEAAAGRSSTSHHTVGRRGGLVWEPHDNAALNCCPSPGPHGAVSDTRDAESQDTCVFRVPSDSKHSPVPGKSPAASRLHQHSRRPPVFSTPDLLGCGPHWLQLAPW